MERQRKNKGAHCLVLPFPIQGHINPMLQFSKRLEQKGVKVTLVTTKFICKTLHKETTAIALESISDGFDNGGMAEAENGEAYVDSFWKTGQQTFRELLEKLFSSGNHVDCVVYDSVTPWALDIAKKFGVSGAVFFTQSCAVNGIYYHVQQGSLKLPLPGHEISLPGLPPLSTCDMPSFLQNLGSYPAFLELCVNQFSNIEKADWVLCNTFYELEQEVADWQAKIWPLKTIGPTIPSMFLDKQILDDKSYGFSLFKPVSSECMKWLNGRPSGSVVYVSFGSLAALDTEQMEEIACGLRESGSYFLWVVRESEQAKLPKDFFEISHKGLVVTWSPQLQVLEHEAVGCFVTHCGWNSTLEAMSLGVPMVAVPQWTDQTTNAKYIMDVWKIGVKAKADEKGIVRRQAINRCIKEVMETERGNEMKKNAIKWKILAAKALDDGGSSNKQIEDFVASLVTSPNASNGERVRQVSI